MKTITFFFFTGLLFISNGLSSQAGAPVTNFSATPNSVCPGESVQFSDMSANNPTTWIWSFKGGSPATSSSQNPVVVYNLPGKYDVILTASNDKGILTIGKLSMVKVMVCSGIGEFEDNFNLQVFPNPAQSFINVMAHIDAPFTLCDAIGSVILMGTIKKGEFTKVDIDNLPAGIYFLSLQGLYGTKNVKVVKE